MDSDLALLAFGPRTDPGRVALAVACVAVATVLRWAMGYVSPDIVPFGLYLPAIVLAALLGGWKSGLAATAMAAGLSWFLFIEPRPDFLDRRGELAFNFALMVAVSSVIVAMASRLRHVCGRLQIGREGLIERNLRYDAIFGSMSEGFALCEAIRGGNGRLTDYEVLEINPALQRMLGVGPEAVGSKLSDGGGDWPEWLAICDRVLRRGKPERFEYENPANGRWHEVHVSRVSETRMAQFFFDISERKTAERRQAELFDELNHRVKNNLSLISGLLQMQGRGESPEVRAKLEKAIDRIGAIAQVHDALSKSGRREDVDFGAYVKQLCEGLERSLIVDDRIDLRVETESAAVSVDTAIPLGMAVNELVTNALKYAYPPPARGAITVRFHREQGGLLLLNRGFRVRSAGRVHGAAEIAGHEAGQFPGGAGEGTPRRDPPPRRHLRDSATRELTGLAARAASNVARPGDPRCRLREETVMSELTAPTLHQVRFPGESATYRAARDELLKAEIALRRQVEAVAAQRRALPAGGAVPIDYVFEEGDEGGAVRLSELFGDKTVLLLYGFMFGPAMERACPSCTSIIDAVDGEIPHIQRKVAIAAVARSPIARFRDFARERGWRNVRLLSSANNSFQRDYHAEDGQGRQRPVLNVFAKGAVGVRHVWASELAFVAAEPGQDPRHVDLIWPLWAALDVSPEGRGDFRPSLAYD